MVPWVKMFITSCLPLVRPALRLIHRQPELPPGLDEFEQRVMESDWPPVVYVDRALIRALLRYVRRLERDLGEGDSGEPRSPWRLPRGARHAAG